MISKWNRMTALLVAIVAVSTIAVSAQQIVWSENNDGWSNISKDKAVARGTFPTTFKLFNLNMDPMRAQLFSIIDARQPSTVISLPNADGGIEQFEVFEASNFEPDLQAQFPDIRAYSGRGLTDKYATLKLTISPQGIQTMVFRTDTENEFIEPFSADHTIYAVYRAHRDTGGMPWSCSTEDKNMFADTLTKLPSNYRPESTSGELKTMRLAQSCNGEYANFFGATGPTPGTPAGNTGVNGVLAAFNATIARVNGVLEKDLAVHFNLIATTTNVIYYDPATDPYTTLGSWNGQLQTTLNTNIGAANYDIGHMFGASGGGGNAGCIGCVCNDANKGSGITSPADAIPQGDNFDIDYVVHEMGHQLGANHSFSMTNEGSGVNMEVGSGITIMGYAGITSQDVAPHSIDTFHAGNIAQIQTNLASKTCPVTTVMTLNHTPVVASVPGATIPISTPFALTGSATDSDGDALTYQWEQIDQTTTSGNASVASPTKATGPNWLSFLPTTTGTRTFPIASTYLAGLFVTPPLPGGDAIANIEALSSVSRSLNFRLTVRDNNPYVPGVKTGQTQSTDTLVTVTSAAGPFKVTSPNTNVSWTGNSIRAITWDVAGTTGNGVNTANVKISYSTNGGNTFPTVLAASTANDGTENVTIPAGDTTTARIKVEAIGNIYFDVSDTNFTVAGLAGPPRSRADFDGDGKTDASVFRPSNGNWYLNRTTAGSIQQIWGLNGDVPTPGDYDNDGKTDLSVWRPGASAQFYTFLSSTNTASGVSWGTTGDTPVVGDYDGDGKSDYSVRRATDNTWYTIKSTGGTTSTTFGSSGDLPLAADYDGDGKADMTLYTTGSSNWNIKLSAGGSQNFPFGVSGDMPVTADYNGDGKDEYAVFRPSNGTWYIIDPILMGVRTITYGTNGDIPVPGDYDGDGSDDVAVYRAGTWYMNRSTAGFLQFNYGVASDIPIPKKYIP